MTRKLTVQDRIERYITIDSVTNCWIWTGSRSTSKWGHTYGYVAIGNTTKSAAKYFYEELIGPVPFGLELDHKVCDTKLCCNPQHVVPVTRAENSQRRSSTILSFDIVREIRRSKGVTSAKELAIRYGIKDFKYIYAIWGNKVWQENLS